MVTVQDVKERWEKIQGDDERILFIVGGPGSGKSLLIRELSEQTVSYTHLTLPTNSRV